VASSEVLYDPLLPEFHANPYLFYRRLREKDPVHASPFGMWILTRYDDAVMVLRDPRFGRAGIAHFADPDRLNVARRENRHIAFGFGIHFCLGAPLARVEGQIAIGTLLRRMPDLTLVSQTPDWRESSLLRGLKTLPVTF